MTLINVLLITRGTGVHTKAKKMHNSFVFCRATPPLTFSTGLQIDTGLSEPPSSMMHTQTQVQSIFINSFHEIFVSADSNIRTSLYMKRQHRL